MVASSSGSEGTHKSSTSKVIDNFDHDAESFPKNYLRTYYSGLNPDPDEEHVLRFCVTHYPKMKGADTFVELGCGPTIHHLLPAAPYVKNFQVADYLEDCNREVRLWKDAAAGAHDWSVFTKFVLECEGVANGANEIKLREQLVRSKISKITHCDLRQPHPLGDPQQFSAVGCFYTIEQACMVGDDWSKDKRRDAWMSVMSSLCSTVAPGGWLFMSCVRNSDHYITYEIGSEVPHRHPLPIVDENDFSNALKRFGFDLSRSEIAGIEFKGQESEGVPGAILVAAKKL